MISKKVSFLNRHGHKLAGYLDLPNTQVPKAYGIFAHCFTCSKQYKLIININQQLTQRGIGILRFDFTGLGDSEGDFSQTTLTTNVQDIIDGASYLTQYHNSPQILVGHSLGGLAALKASLSLDYIKAVSIIGTPYDLKSLTHLLKQYDKDFQSKGKATINIAGRPFSIGHNFLRDMKNQNILQDIQSLKVPLLIFQATDDKIVPFDEGVSLFEMAPKPKSFVAIKDGNHLLTGNNDSIYVGSLLGEWTLKYLD